MEKKEDIQQPSTPKTAKQLLHEFEAASQGKVHITHNEQEFIGTLTIGEKVLRVTYPYQINHNFCKHEISRLLLELAAYDDDRTWQSILTLGDRFYRGKVFPYPEGHTVEFKGGADKDATMAENSVINIGDTIGEEICSFANAEGGSVYVGIHDSGVIQGIAIADRDKFELRIGNKLSSKFWPKPCFRQHLHKVCFSTAPKTTLPPRPAEVDNYTAQLEAEYSRLKQYVDQLAAERKPSDKQLYVMEFRVAKAEELTFFDNRAYVRRNNAKVELTILEQKARFIEEYKQQHNQN